MNAKPDFSDLIPRIFSAFFLILLGLGCMWSGGYAFSFFLIIITSLMAWETSRMHSNQQIVPFFYGLIIGTIALSMILLPVIWCVLMMILGLGMSWLLHHTRLPVVITTIAILITCATLFMLRTRYGFEWTLWLVLVVVASDVGGYFAGKLIGGPKILPTVSPKKTWSGTLGGWILAAFIGVFFVQFDMGGKGLIMLSVVMAVAAQIGDLLESLMKRRAGIKDTSNLIPGHGGLLDRFDGTVSASVVLGLLLALGGANTLGFS
ncbi:MAG: phosphatidate cytidylyltransferase [Amylibacter sp.]|nr:phosphatidate cytidylyltransferase [Amylibacter sp.]